MTTSREASLPTPDVDSWHVVQPYAQEFHAEHVLDLEWEISVSAEQPRDAEGNDLDPKMHVWYGAHVGVQVSDLKYVSWGADTDINTTVESTWLSPERALEVAWALAEAAQACRDRLPDANADRYDGGEFIADWDAHIGGSA